jgi:integrase
MSVRKREWTTTQGEQREAWIVDYFDAGGTRRLKTFKRKKDADAWSNKTGVAVLEGTHIADSASITVHRAGELWLKTCEAAGLERSTLDQYRQHLRFHIVGNDAPADEQAKGLFIGSLKLSQLNAPTVRAFEDRLAEAGRSPAMVRYVIRSLGSLLADAQERGYVTRNAVRELRARRRRGNGREERRNGNLKVGIDIPTTDEIRAIVAAAKGRWRPFLITAIFTGMRASELRGLLWSAVDLRHEKIHVRQRADRFNAIGPPKSAAGERTIPLPPIVVGELREWKLRCPKKDGRLELVFPTGEGNPESLANIIGRGLKPTLIAAGVTVPRRDTQGGVQRDEHGKPMVETKYTGLHALRHFYASWCINRKADGGLELPAKMVQARMGHSSILVTMNIYAHLFPGDDSGAELAAAQRALLG